MIWMLRSFEKKIQTGDIMLCFTMPVISGSKIYIAYGRQRRMNRVNIIGVSRQQVGSAKMCLGLAYVKCEMDEDKYAAVDVSLDETEHTMRSYGLRLPFEQDEKFQHRHAIVYHDWDVGDIMFEQMLPNICEECFNVDLLED